MGSIWKWKRPWTRHCQMASQPERGNFVAGKIWLLQDTWGSSWPRVLAWVPPAACHQLLLVLPLLLFSPSSCLAAIFFTPQKWSDETSVWCGLSQLKCFGDFVAGRCLPLWNKPLVRAPLPFVESEEWRHPTGLHLGRQATCCPGHPASLCLK